MPTPDEKARRKVLWEARRRADAEAQAGLFPPTTWPSDRGSLATLDFFLWVAFGDPLHPDMRRASDLAGANVHHALQAALAELGAVEVWTETDAGDVACAYRVSAPSGLPVDVEVSTVLPYAVVLATDERGGSRYVTPVGDDWTGQVVDRVRRHGLLPLTAETCRATSLVVDAAGEPLTYFQVLFRDWTDTP